MNRKKSIIVVVSLIIPLLFTGCANIEQTYDKQQTYENAIAQLKQTTLNENGTYTVTDDLIVALQNTEFTEPKNIIYMIGDGMGANIIQATQETYAKELYEHKLAINHLPKVGTQSTYSANTKITDSAAGGTALATGRKTSNGTVAMNPEHTEDYKTVLELAAEKGKSTGVVVTKSVTDATPATFSSHVTDRSLQEEIAMQQLEKISDGSLDLVLGGGSGYYEHSENAVAIEEAKNNGMSYSTSWSDTVEDELPLVGLYAADALNTVDEDIPTLAEMTDLALELLSEDEEGFFLMVEGSQIDTKAHANLLDKEIHEMYQFDSAIAVAMRFVALNPDTVIIITADHETGGLYFPQEGYGDNGKYVYLTGDHTSINVPVYAIGYGTDELGGIMENTDIGGFVASLLGENDFEQESVVTSIYKAKESGTIKMSFDEDVSSMELLTDEMATAMKQVKNSRAIHLVVRNTGKDMATLPALKIASTVPTPYEVVPQDAYIDAGETLELTYILPVELWKNNALSDVKSIRVSYDVVSDNSWKSIFGYYTEEIKLEIIEISITDRILEK